MSILDDSRIGHGDMMIQIYESDVVTKNGWNLLETSWVKPISTEKLDIVSLSKAASTPDNVMLDLLDAFAIGDQQYATFKEEKHKA